MIRKIKFIFIIILIIPASVQAAYYTIQLKNGNNIDVDNYWDLKTKIKYYTQEGSIELPKNIIKNISSAEGSLEPRISFYPTDEYFDKLEQKQQTKDELLSTESPVSSESMDDEISEDIKDRISIMEINIENLHKNKNTYLSQQKNFMEQKQILEKRIENYKEDTYTDPDVVNTKVNRLLQQVEKLDNNINAIDVKIRQTENLMQKQKNMKQRLQKQLANAL